MIQLEFLTEDEIAERRQEQLAELPEKYGEDAEEMAKRWRNEVALREALHTSFIMHENVERYLASHPCVIFDTEAHRLAVVASMTLFELYQRIGSIAYDAEEDAKD